MNYKKIFVMVVLLLGVYFIFINSSGNVIDSGKGNNNNYNYNDDGYKRGELTEKYFQWAKEELKISDPKITATLLDKFFNEVVVPELKITSIPDSDIKIAPSTKENLKNYLETSSKIKILPDEKDIDYAALAQTTLKNSNNELLKKVIASIDAAINDLNNIAVPLEAKDTHKKYLGLIKYMRVMFNDLNYAKEDPLKINYNQRLSQKIIALSEEIIKEREKLANSLK